MFCFFPRLYKIRIKEKGSPSQKYPPEKLGEYYIVRNGEIYYIGKSVDLRRRMHEHRHSGKLQTGDIFYYRLAMWGKSQEELSEHERKMIAKYNPPGNKSKGGEGRVQNKYRYWRISGGLELLLFRLAILAGILLLIAAYFYVQGDLDAVLSYIKEQLLPDLLALLRSWKQSLLQYWTTYINGL